MKTLYKKTSTNKIQQWSIHYDKNVIITIFGLKDGKLQTTRDVITSGKNTGKRNSTTPEEQAQLEAEAQYNKKLKSGYVTSIEDAQAGKKDDIIQGGIDPMLAHTYDKHGHKMMWSAYISTKIDGIRCIAIIPSNSEPTLWTRTRKPITSLPHIIESLKNLRQNQTIILDGELFNYEYRNNFEEIVSLVRSEEPKVNHEMIEYHVFDIVNQKQFEQRWIDLQNLSLKDPIKLVQQYKCSNEKEARELYATFLADGHEGAMIRNPLSLYEHKRSYGLLKMKDFQDAEFEVIGVEEGRGKLMGHAGSMICKLPDGRAFNAKMTGSHDNLRKMFLDPPIGQMLTVKFQNYTSDGIPRFPVATYLRNYE